MRCRKCKAEIADGSKFCNSCGAKQIYKVGVKTRGNGQGTAVKRGNTWRAIWTIETYCDEDKTIHQRRRTKDGFKTKTAALAYASNPPMQTAKKVPTLRNYWNVFASSALLEISKSRQGSYKTAWKKMADIAGMKTNELTIGTLQAVVKKEAPTYYPAKDMKTVLTALFEMAVAEHNAWANLGNFIVLPKLDEKVPEPFTQEELYTIWEAYGNGETFCGYLLLMIYTGMMPGELLKLRPEMISWDTNEIIGDGLKNDIRKKQPIVFPEIIVPVMEDLLTRTSPKTGRVVPIGKDKFYKLYHATTEKIGIRDLKPYSCRHTTATALALGDTVLAPSVIQAVMRHSKFSTTQRYIHPDSTSKVAAVNTMGKGKAPGEVPTTPDSSN